MGFNYGDVVASSGGPVYQLNNSLRFDTLTANYLNRTPATAGNRKTWTYSFWVKRGGYNTSTVKTLFTAGASVLDCFMIAWGSGNNIFITSIVGGVENRFLFATQTYVDFSSWYHFVIVWDTTQAISNDRIKLYVNGIRYEYFSTLNMPALNADGFVNSVTPHLIGYGYNYSVGGYMDGYMTEINFLDGIVPTFTTRTVNGLTQTVLTQLGAFSPMTGSWEARKWTGSYGTNGFYLNFSNGTSTTTLGYDSSGLSNNWTLNGFTRATGITDCWCIDVPAGNAAPGPAARPASNYCVLNQLEGVQPTVYAGGVKTFNTAAHVAFRGSMAIPTTGKYYFEVFVNTTTSATVAASVGVCTKNTLMNIDPTVTTGMWGLYAVNLTYFLTDSAVLAYTASTVAANSVLQVAYDADEAILWIGKNNVWYNSTGGTTGNPSAGTNPTNILIPGTEVFPYVECYAENLYANFGQFGFYYTPPTGFRTLCTSNIVQSKALNGGLYMSANTYLGNGTTQTLVNQYNMQPDLVWVKDKSNAEWHILTDSNTGVSKYWSTNSLNQQTTGATTYINAITSTGFTVGSATAVNRSGAAGDYYVAWQWQAGKGVTSTNTAGQCASTVCVNLDAGFSIVKYTGTGTTYGSSPSYITSVGHGLNATPKAWMVKRLDAANNTYNAFYTTGVDGSVDLFQINLTAAKTDSGTSSVTSATISLPFGNSNFGASGGTYVMYAWAEVPGFSKFGSYLGTGVAPGPFVNTGFRPKFIMIKCSSTTGNWQMFDTSQNQVNTNNGVQYFLKANVADAEVNGAQMVVLSNGFKPTTTSADYNAAQTYFYMAFAENPFAQANAR